MTHYARRLFAACLPLAMFPAAAAAVPSFPGAVGAGAYTAGGSGRHAPGARVKVFLVDSLSDSGGGTLRECVEARGPRTCVIVTSGRLRLSRPLRVRNPFLTIAGQTAPSPGLTMTGAGLVVNTHDVVVRHVRIRVGDDPDGPPPGERDGVSVGGRGEDVFGIVLDHLSVSWAVDENVSLYPSGDSSSGPRDVTVSSCVIAEGLEKSIHPKGPHGKGMMIGDGSERVSVVRNLFVHNADRNPYVKPGSTVEMVGNVVYDWGRSRSNLVNVSAYDRDARPVSLNFVGNAFWPGPSGPPFAPVYAKPPAAGTRVFAASNDSPVGDGSDWSSVALPATPHRAAAPVDPHTFGATPRPEPDLVLVRAGARPADRDPVDVRVTDEARTRSGTLKDCVSGCERHAGGYPKAARSVRKVSVPKDPSSDRDGNGYTALEDWLESYAAAVEGRGPEPALPRAEARRRKAPERK